MLFAEMKNLCIREDYGSEYVIAYLKLCLATIESRGVATKTYANKIGVSDEMLKIFKKIGLILYEERQIAVKHNKKIMVK